MQRAFGCLGLELKQWDPLKEEARLSSTEMGTEGR